MLLLIASLFFSNPAPLDMPRANAHTVVENGVPRLEDRYNKLELWMSQAIIGRWVDDDGRVFILSALDFAPPAVGLNENLTRIKYVGQRLKMDRVSYNKGYPRQFRVAVELLAPTQLTDGKPRSIQYLPHGYRDVDYWQAATNYSAVVCSFRRQGFGTWYLAYWQLLDGDDYATQLAMFEDRFLREEFGQFIDGYPYSVADKTTGEKQQTERGLMRADSRHSIAAYSNWHCTDGEEFSILDDLPDRDFINVLIQDFTVMRKRYAEVMPTMSNVSNTLCVARIYATRDEYLDALTVEGRTNLLWSGGVWLPNRREIVAYLPHGSESSLLRTMRHEAFHQYVDYATLMHGVSVWLNEGYAQYFEDEDNENWDYRIGRDGENRHLLENNVQWLLTAKYREFYDDDDWRRHCNYHLAWSIAVFLEKGAGEVPFQPFKNLKRDYFRSLFTDWDYDRATDAAFGNNERQKELFVKEWMKFWQGR